MSNDLIRPDVFVGPSREIEKQGRSAVKRWWVEYRLENSGKLSAARVRHIDAIIAELEAMGRLNEAVTDFESIRLKMKHAPTTRFAEEAARRERLALEEKERLEDAQSQARIRAVQRQQAEATAGVRGTSFSGQQQQGAPRGQTKETLDEENEEFLRASNLS